MINPDDITTVRVGQLPTDNVALSDKITFEKGTDLKQNTVEHLANFIATFIDASDGASFLPESVSNGQTLPETTTNEWMLVGSGTFTNVGGGDDIECIELLNVLISNGTTWSLGVAIPINVDDSFVSQTIIEDVLTTSPSENAVFNALNNKYDASNPSNFQTLAEVLSRIDDAIQDVPYDETTWNGVTDDAPSMNSVRDKFVSVDSNIALKQDVLVSDTNIKTVNSNSLLGSGNIVVGDISNSSTAIGQNSGLNNTAIGNVFYGSDSGKSNTTGTSNSFIGTNSGELNTTGANNTFLGFNSGTNNTNGGTNTFIGYGTGQANVSGNSNTFIGYNSGVGNLNANNNSFYGVNSGSGANTGGGNTFNGVQSGQSNTSGANNTFLGFNSGQSNTTGSTNTFVGNNSGRYLTDGVTNNSTSSNSVFIGNNTRSEGSTQTNQIVIGDNAIGAGSNSSTIGNTSVTKAVVNGKLFLPTTPTSVTATTEKMVIRDITTGELKTADILSVIAGSFSATGTATTTFTVTIGSTQADALYKVVASPSNALSAVMFYINNKTTTTFDVVFVTGLTGAVAFDWILKP